MKYQLADDLVARFQPNGQICLLVLSSGAFVYAPPLLLQSLSELHAAGEFTLTEVVAAIGQICGPASAAMSLATSLQAIRAIRPIDSSHTEDPGYPWTELGWGAPELLHAAVSDTHFLQGDSEGWRVTAEASSRMVATDQEPPGRKVFPTNGRIELPEPGVPTKNLFGDVLLERRTCRSFSPTHEVDQETLSTLLHYAARAHGRLYNRWFGEHMLRTTPSGGARHPVELYPQILRSRDIQLGSYYYQPYEHALYRLGSSDPELIHSLGQHQSGCANVPLAFIVSARFCVNLWKYRYPKSYIFTLFDVGHFVQTLLICCEATGLNTFLTPAINTSIAQQHLGLPNIFDECAMYLVTAGRAL